MFTNDNGLINLEIGNGKSSNNFSEIVWDMGPYYIKIEIDPFGGEDYTITSTNQLLSVLYALHAKTADNVSDLVTLKDDIKK